MINHLDSWLNQHSGLKIPFVILLLGLVAALDYSLSAEVSTALFYLIPVLFAAWYSSRYTAIFTVLAAALLWGLNDMSTSPHYSDNLIPLWNSGVRLGIFVLMATLLQRLRLALTAERAAADSDALTGLLNRRGFNERLQAEHARALRYQQTFTLAYLDVDNFKQVNDSRGHKAGDLLLTSIADELRKGTRQSDALGRLGGDEFAILMPLATPESAQRALQLCQQRLNERMSKEQWPVSFSIGVVTYVRPPAQCHDAVTQADKLMYQVKHQGKNNALFAIWDGEPQGAPAPDQPSEPVAEA